MPLRVKEPLAEEAQERHHREYKEADDCVHQSLVDDLASHTILAPCDEVLGWLGECRADPLPLARGGRQRPAV